MRLQDRVAIVTGGGVGIGRTYSLGLAREGAKVLIADIDDEGASRTLAMIQDSGGEATAIHTDTSDEVMTLRMAREALDRYGRIDLLVNNAALFTATPLREWDEIDVEEWDRVMAVNLRGPFLCCKAVVPAMKQRNYGKIINVSSASIIGGNPRRAHYVTSKAGLIGFTRSLARALGPYNICVNSLLPGSTASEGAVAAYGSQQFEHAPSNRPIPRVERPEDLLGTLIFLASSDSDFVTGQAIVVDGGVYMY